MYTLAEAIRLSKEAPMAPVKGAAQAGVDEKKRRILVSCDNAAVKYIVKSMVTASREMMPELRKV